VHRRGGDGEGGLDSEIEEEREEGKREREERRVGIKDGSEKGIHQ
jgi:hypothetical protein